jgi:hypothetical protein
MTPQFNIFCWDKCLRSEVLPQNIYFFPDFDSDLQRIRTFSHQVCSLEVVTDFEKLQFTFSSLALPYPAQPYRLGYCSFLLVALSRRGAERRRFPQMEPAKSSRTI